MEILSENKSFEGRQLICAHDSKIIGTPMRFSVFLPPQAEHGNCAVVWYLSGLTCTEENVTVKGGFQRAAAELGLVIVCPDTSPRGANIEGEDERYDFGTGAGFYVDATQKPWSKNYRMYSYITEELQQLIIKEFPVDSLRQGITGHSMGGHGALVLSLRNPELYTSVSAFAPIAHPSNCPWGQGCLGGYLGADDTQWAQYDATRLLKAGNTVRGRILVDQGAADDFLVEQLKPDHLQQAAEQAGQAIEVNLREGYDHSYYFVSSFMEDHLRHHARQLT